MALYDGVVSAHYPQPPFWEPHVDELWEEEELTQQFFTNLNAAFVPQQYAQQSYPSWFAPSVSQDTSITGSHHSALGVYPASYWMQEPVQYTSNAPQRCISPAHGGPPPLSPDNSWSGSQSNTGSPASTPSYSSEMATRFSACMSFDGSSAIKQSDVYAGAPCVALTDVQQYADAQSDEDAPFEEDPVAFPPTTGPEEFQLSVAMVQGSDADAVLNDDRVDSGAEHPVPTPNFRRRQTHDSRAHDASRGPKRSHGKKRSLARQAKTKAENNNAHHLSPSRRDRAFPCALATYGCRASFGSKNEWKRHINTQHMRLGFWRCDQCDLGACKTNDFNRKDLFIQHLRRMHDPKAEQGNGASGSKSAKGKNGRTGGKPSKHDPNEQALIATAKRCFYRTRDAPRHTGCFFCPDTFTGSAGWEERLEHIGKHMENAKRDHHPTMDPYCWQEDAELEEWLLDQKVVVQGSEGYVLADGTL